MHTTITHIILRFLLFSYIFEQISHNIDTTNKEENYEKIGCWSNCWDDCRIDAIGSSTSKQSIAKGQKDN